MNEAIYPVTTSNYQRLASILLMAVVGTVLVFVSFPTVIFADALNPGLFSKDSSPYGTPYAQWLSKWWQWNMEIPEADHPRNDYSPEKCDVNQSGPVWFLPDFLGGKEERTCTIPAGKAILVPLQTGEYHNDPTDIVPLTDEQLIETVMKTNEYGVISATLDGTTLKNLGSYRSQSLHNITVPADNSFGNLPGYFRGAADGFFLFLEPLAPGKHELNLKTNVVNPIDPSFNYGADGLYHLIIEP